MFGALSLRNYGSTQQRHREIIVCLLLSPLKFQEKMRFLLLALDPGVFPPPTCWAYFQIPTAPAPPPSASRELPVAFLLGRDREPGTCPLPVLREIHTQLLFQLSLFLSEATKPSWGDLTFQLQRSSTQPYKGKCFPAPRFCGALEAPDKDGVPQAGAVPCWQGERGAWALI